MKLKIKMSGLGELFPFFLYYAFFFVGAAAIVAFMNVYFKEELKLSLAQIGMISSIGPVMTIFAQPLWGILSDRTNKRVVLMVIIFCAMCVSILFPLHHTFFYIAIVAMFHAMFNNSIVPLGDAITLQYVETKKIKYNTIRMIGTISYALMAAVVGYFVGQSFSRIFYIYAFCMGITFIAVFFMPDVQKFSKEKISAMPLKKSLAELFQNKFVVCILASSLVFGLTMAFYHAFFGIQMRNLGADEIAVGRAMFLSAASEVPVLIFINKLFGKRKPVHILMIVGFLMAFRLVLLFLADLNENLAIVYFSQLFHGLTFMVHFYFSVTLLNAHAPVQIKSTVQSIHAVVRAIAALIGAGLGGGIAFELGIGKVYLILAGFVFATCFVLPLAGLLFQDFYKQKIK